MSTADMSTADPGITGQSVVAALTAGFGNTYIGFPALQAWLTGAVVYLVAVALVARNPRAKALLGYSRVPETTTAAEPLAGGRS